MHFGAMHYAIPSILNDDGRGQTRSSDSNTYLRMLSKVKSRCDWEAFLQSRTVPVRYIDEQEAVSMSSI